MAEKSNEELIRLAAEKQKQGRRVEQDERPRRKAVSAPNIRRGEDPLTSRGYRFSRLLGALATKNFDQAKVEAEVAAQLLDLGYQTQMGGVIVPLNPWELEEEHLQLRGLTDLFGDVRPSAGAERKLQYLKRVLQESDDTLGGYLVAPEQSAEIIPLLRTQAVVERAGARVLTLPQSGQLDIPRQTNGATAYWVGENERITESDVKPGLMSLREKFLGVAIRASNRVLRHSNPSIEAMLREDIANVVALEQDKQFIMGTGGMNVPLGIKNIPNVNVTDQGGSALTPEMLIDLRQEVKKNFGVPNAFLFNTDVESKIWKFRGGTLDSTNAANYSVGPFVFLPSLDGAQPSRVLNMPYFTTEQITTAANQTDIYAGQFSEAVIARGATMEIVASTEAEDVFLQDQVLFRAILGVDFGLRQPSVFSVFTSVDVS